MLLLLLVVVLMMVVAQMLTVCVRVDASLLLLLLAAPVVLLLVEVVVLLLVMGRSFQGIDAQKPDTGWEGEEKGDVVRLRPPKKGASPTTNGGMPNRSSVGRCTRCMHVFAMFGTSLCAQSVLFSKISASELSRKFIKGALLVGVHFSHLLACCS